MLLPLAKTKAAELSGGIAGLVREVLAEIKTKSMSIARAESFTDEEKAYGMVVGNAREILLRRLQPDIDALKPLFMQTAAKKLGSGEWSEQRLKAEFDEVILGWIKEFTNAMR